MSTSYKNRFQKFSNLSEETQLIKHARHTGSNTFCRNQKMPLKEMLLCYLSKKGLTTVFELRNYFKENEKKYTIICTRIFTATKTYESRNIFLFKQRVSFRFLSL